MWWSGWNFSKSVSEIFPETSGQSSEKVIGIFLKSSVENLGEVPEIFLEFYRFLLMCENCIFRTLNYREFSGDLLAFLYFFFHRFIPCQENTFF